MLAKFIPSATKHQRSKEMLRVPDYYDDMDILTDEDDDENDENDFNVQGSSTKKRNLYEEDDDEDSFSDN
jgi:hypothetical protein